MYQEKRRIRKRIIIWLLVGIGMFFLPVKGNQASAATTCKSVISYPGETRAKVNIRKKAGVRYKSYGMVNKKEKVIIRGYVTSGGMKWYKCKAYVKGKVKEGYISAAYVKQQSKPKGIVNEKVKTTVNVRKKAKTSSSVVAKIKKGSDVTVTGIKKVSNSSYWYKVKVKYKNKTKTGYILSKYVTVSGAVLGSKSNTGDSTQEVSEKEAYVNEKVSTTLNVRKSASTGSSVLARIPRGTIVSVIGESGSWYKIRLTYMGKTITGYVAKEYITINKKPADNTPVSNAEFSAILSAFPESYRASLQALHNTYPNWRFQAVLTNLDWNTVIANESVVGRNVMQSNYPKGTASLAPFSYLSTASGAYNWGKDTYTVKDGANWYSVNSQVVAHYMDPRNFLNDTDIFQFETLSYDDSHSVDVVQSILNNTFMKGKYSVKDSATGKTVSGSYAQAFMEAGKKSGANPYFLAARCKQEVGAKGSNSTSGNYSGYKGIYNYYNIGASDGTNAVAKGLSFAKSGTTYERPWTNPYKAIVGGAEYIAKNYINIGQNTLYFQKFNVAPANKNQLYLHQYMTNIQAPYSEGRSTRAAYRNIGVLSNTMIFSIPVYNNMPASACALPAVSGNPNPYLSSITVQNAANTSVKGTFNTPFAYNVYNYTVTVPSNVSQVLVSASAVSKYAQKPDGAGKVYTLSGTSTKIVITGIAQNGARQQYVLNIIKQ